MHAAGTWHPREIEDAVTARTSAAAHQALSDAQPERAGRREAVVSARRRGSRHRLAPSVGAETTLMRAPFGSLAFHRRMILAGLNAAFAVDDPSIENEGLADQLHARWLKTTHCGAECSAVFWQQAAKPAIGRRNRNDAAAAGDSSNTIRAVATYHRQPRTASETGGHHLSANRIRGKDHQFQAPSARMLSMGQLSTCSTDGTEPPARGR